LREIVTDATRYEPVGVFASELLRVGAWVGMGSAIGVAFQRYGGNGDRRGLGEPLFQIVIFCLTFGEA
jgi:hypothetical protein